MSFNRVVLVGYLTRDPELGRTAKQVAVTRIGLAVNRRWRSESGEEREEVTFVDVDLYRNQAEAACRYLRKGSAVLVEGRLHLDQWEKNGERRSRLGVVGEQVNFLDSAKSVGSAKSAESAGSSMSAKGADSAKVGEDGWRGAAVLGWRRREGHEGGVSTFF